MKEVGKQSNEEVVEFLEARLEEARNGEIQGLLMLYRMPGDMICDTWVGDMYVDETIGAMERCKFRFLELNDRIGEED